MQKREYLTAIVGGIAVIGRASLCSRRNPWSPRHKGRRRCSLQTAVSNT